MAVYDRGMHPADDKRALFARVVDDIVDQIRTGKLAPGDVLPTSRKMADLYDVASMTAQRALRELQTMGLTYGVVGKGTFVHPQAPDRVRILDGQAATDNVSAPVTDPAINTQLAEHLLMRNTLVNLTLELFETKDKARRAAITTEINLLTAILDGQRKDLQPDLDAYQTRLAQAAGKPADTVTPPSNDEPPKRTRRTPTK